MQPHQERVVSEKEELDERARKLSEFIGTNPMFEKIDPDEQERMKEQCEIMWQYSEILGKRIAAFLVLIALILVSIPAQAQSRVFRASDIDLQQDSRIQVLEIQVEALQKVVAEFSRPIPTPDPLPNAEPEPVIQIPKDDTKYVRLGDLKEINGELVRLTQVGDSVKWMPVKKQVTQRQTTVSTSTSNRYSTSELKAIAAGYRGPMEAYVEPRSWAREHLQNDHGFSRDQVAGLTTQEAVVIHSMAHGGRIKPYRSSTSKSVTYAVTMPDPATIAMPKTLPPPAYSSDCPNGQCPNVRGQSSTQPRYRTPFFGRLRR